MWCINCGNQLPDEAKFCMGCGTKVVKPNQDLSKVPNDKLKKSTNIELRLHNKTIKLPMEIKEYIFLKNEYESMAIYASNYICENYMNKYRSLSGVVKYAEEDIKAVLSSALNDSVEIIEKVCNQRINENDFLNSLDNYSVQYQGILDQYKESYKEIVETRDAQKEYREIRKSGRGKVIGGGFGVGGALKGMAMAGTVNAATGMLHSISNAIGNAGTDSKAYNAMDSVYQDKDLQFDLFNAVYNDINNLCYEVISFINDRFKRNIPNYYTERNYNKAMSICDTIIEANGQIDNVQDKIVEMIFEYPFTQKFYEVAMAICGDNLEGLNTYGEFFGVNMHEIRNRLNNIKENNNKLYSIFGENKEFLEEALRDNPIYSEYKYDLSDNYIKNIELVYENIKFKQLNYLPQETNDSEVSIKYENARESYAKFRGENPLFLFDNTSFGSAKDGFIITDKKIYYHNMMESSKNIQIDKVDSIYKNYDSAKMYINDQEIGLDLVDKKERILFKDFIEYVICMLKCNKSEDMSNGYLEEEYSHEEIEGKGCVDIIDSVTERILSIKNAKIKKYLYAINESEIANKKFENAYSTYLSLDENEEMIVLYDNTGFGSAKDGFVLTNASIQIHNMMSKPVKVYYDEIKELYVKGSDLVVNSDVKALINLIDSRSRKEFEDIILDIINIINK